MNSPRIIHNPSAAAYQRRYPVVLLFSDAWCIACGARLVSVDADFASRRGLTNHPGATDSTTFSTAGAGLRVGYGFVGRNPCKPCTIEAAALRPRHGGIIVAGNQRFHRVPQTAAKNRVRATTPSSKEQGAGLPSWRTVVSMRRCVSALRRSKGLPQKLGFFLFHADEQGGDTTSRRIIEAREQCATKTQSSADGRCKRQTTTALTRSKMIA